MMRKLVALGSGVGLVVVLSVAMPAKAYEPSGGCWSGITVPIVAGEAGVPLWLTVTMSSPSLGGLGVGLCYATGPEGSSKIAGGQAFVGLGPRLDHGLGPAVVAGNDSDENAAVQADTFAFARPAVFADPGWTYAEQALVFTHTFILCFNEDCDLSTLGSVGETGVVVGTLSPQPNFPMGGYTLSSLCVYIDGEQFSPWCNTVIDLPPGL